MSTPPTPSQVHGLPSPQTSFTSFPFPDPFSSSSPSLESEWWKWRSPRREDATKGIDWRPTKPSEVTKAGDNYQQKMVGKWRLGESLGRGSSGRVRIARRIETGEYAAVKKVRRMRDTPNLAEIIQREIVVQKLVEHPHILKLYDVFETTLNFFLVTEYCPHGELYGYVMTHNLSLPTIQKFFSQLVTALAHLHYLSISHRDVKFENLLLVEDPDGELSLKLADLGLAAFQPPGSLLKSSCGSPHYASPEIITGDQYDGPPADVWSAGVVLFALVAKRLPFDDENIPTMLQMIKRGNYEIPSSLQNPARDLVKRMLVVDVKKRISIEGVIKHSFLSNIRPLTEDYGQLPYPLSIGIGCELPQSIDELDPDLLQSLSLILRGREDLDEVSVDVMTQPGPKLFYIILRNFKNRNQVHSVSQNFPPSPVNTSSQYDSVSHRALRRARSLLPPMPPPTSPLPPTPTSPFPSPLRPTLQSTQPSRKLSMLVPMSVDDTEPLGWSHARTKPLTSSELIEPRRQSRLVTSPARNRRRESRSLPPPLTNYEIEGALDLEAAKDGGKGASGERTRKFSMRYIKNLFSDGGSNGGGNLEETEGDSTPGTPLTPFTPEQQSTSPMASSTDLSNVKKSTAYESITRAIVKMRGEKPTSLDSAVESGDLRRHSRMLTSPEKLKPGRVASGLGETGGGKIKRGFSQVEASSEDDENIPMVGLNLGSTTPRSPRRNSNIEALRTPRSSPTKTSPSKRRPAPLSLLSPNNGERRASLDDDFEFPLPPPRLNGLSPSLGTTSTVTSFAQNQPLAPQPAYPVTRVSDEIFDIVSPNPLPKLPQSPGVTVHPSILFASISSTVNPHEGPSRPPVADLLAENASLRTILAEKEKEIERLKKVCFGNDGGLGEYLPGGRQPSQGEGFPWQEEKKGVEDLTARLSLDEGVASLGDTLGREWLMAQEGIRTPQ